jgi:hypothetical protein
MTIQLGTRMQITMPGMPSTDIAPPSKEKFGRIRGLSRNQYRRFEALAVFKYSDISVSLWSFNLHSIFGEAEGRCSERYSEQLNPRIFAVLTECLPY